MWFLYLILCDDGTIYTGISPTPEKRFQTHQAGKGAKYTKTRSPLQLIYTELVGTRSEATKKELKVKKLSHLEKRKLAGLS